MIKDDEISKSNIYGKDYFDSGKRKTGRFANYSYSKLFPSYEKLASILINITAPKKVLDIGCAKGFLVQAFRNSGVECFGVDVSEYAISQAPEEIRQFLKIHDMDKQNLPFINDSFDMVTAVGVLEYLQDHLHAIKEIRRLLKDDGMLFLTVAYLSPNDKYRITLQSKQDWIREFESMGFEFQAALSDKNYSSLLINFLRSSTSTKAALSRLLLFLPGGQNLLKSYSERRWGILFFRAKS